MESEVRHRGFALDPPSSHGWEDEAAQFLNPYEDIQPLQNDVEGKMGGVEGEGELTEISGGIGPVSIDRTRDISMDNEDGDIWSLEKHVEAEGDLKRTGSFYTLSELSTDEGEGPSTCTFPVPLLYAYDLV